MKKYMISATALGLVAFGAYHQQAKWNSPHAARTIAQIESSRNVVKDINDIAELRIRLRDKQEELATVQASLDELNQRFSTEVFSEIELYNLGKVEEGYRQQISQLKREIAKIESKNERALARIDQNERQQQIAFCQAQKKTAKLEEQLNALIADKEKVAKAIIQESAPVETNDQSNYLALYMGLTNLLQSMQFSFQQQMMNPYYLSYNPYMTPFAPSSNFNNFGPSSYGVSPFSYFGANTLDQRYSSPVTPTTMMNQFYQNTQLSPTGPTASRDISSIPQFYSF